MLHDLSSRISKVTNLKYLTPLVLYESKDKHYYLSLLYRIQNIGIHHVLCVKLREMDIKEEIPQLIEIMLKPIDGSPISYPIFNLLLSNARNNIFFRVQLFFRLKSVLSTVDENLASHCYFLCCAILELDSKENKRNITEFKTRRRISLNVKKLVIIRNIKKRRILPLSRQFSISKRSRMPDFHGLMLFFTKALISIFKSPLHRQIEEFYRSFENKKSYKNLQFRLGQTPFKSNVMFYENLADISSTLKKMPLHLRQRTLKILLEFTNLQLGQEIIDPFNRKKKIVNLVLEYAKPQDSAENCPFVVIAEVANRNLTQYNFYNSTIKKTRVLLKQLESLNDLDDVGDVDGIKESILTAVENILFVQKDVVVPKSLTLNEVELKDERISDNKLCKNAQSCIDLSALSQINSLDQPSSDIKALKKSCPNLHLLSDNCNLNDQNSDTLDILDENLQIKPSSLVFNTEELENLSLEENRSKLLENCNSHILSSYEGENSECTTHDEKETKTTSQNSTSSISFNDQTIDINNTLGDQSSQNLKELKSEVSEILSIIANQNIEILDKSNALNNSCSFEDQNLGILNSDTTNVMVEDDSSKVNSKMSVDQNMQIDTLNNKIITSGSKDSSIINQNHEDKKDNNIDQSINQMNNSHFMKVNNSTTDNSASTIEEGIQQSIDIENTKTSENQSLQEPHCSLENFDTLVTGDIFAELVPSLSLEPKIIHDSPKKQQDSHFKRIFIDVYACDNSGVEPLAENTDRSLKYIKEKLALNSSYSKYPGWGITSFIVKSGGILKHEFLAYQALSQMKEIFILEKLPIYLKNYQISLISDTSGLVELVQDAQSIHRIKFESKFKTLLSYFENTFKGENFKKAKDNFLYSLVGYSLASYILQIKDRHNGNLLIDSFGHIIHVDFGFTFGKFPGVLVSIENAPFKFSSEYLELIDLDEFKDLFILGLKALRKHREKAIRLIEIMKESGYYDRSIFEGIVQRFKIGENDSEIEAFCQSLISNALSSRGTAIYDHYQYFYHGYH